MAELLAWLARQLVDNPDAVVALLGLTGLAGILMRNTLILTQQVADNFKEGMPALEAVVEAVDQAAAVLGNTRSVARSSYVHPDLLSVYADKNFSKYYSKATKARKLPGLDKRESELLHLLEELFKTEFDLLKS